MANFFEFREEITMRAREARSRVLPAPASSATAPQPLSVSQLTRMIDGAIKKGVPSSVLVRGELSNVNFPRASGHLYFTMKDADACIDCVMWASDLARLRFEPADGIEVLVSGFVSIYAVKSKYQLYARKIEAMGRGALEIAFRQLHDKLQAEGLFDPARKRPLPRYPLRIALVTSRDGAALQDILKVLRRFAWLKLREVHVPVQGDGACHRIAAALIALSREPIETRPEVIVLARGGGSLEDLWEFNQEVVARAVADSQIPIITGIGHEIDTSIADLVADHHAHTPTEAAQIVSNYWRTIVDELDARSLRLRRGLRALISDARQRLNLVVQHEYFRRPIEPVNRLRQRLDDRQRELSAILKDRLRRTERRMESLDARLRRHHPRHHIRLCDQKLCVAKIRLDAAMHGVKQRLIERVALADGRLAALSPQAVLARGYSITTLKRGGRIVKSISDVKAGDAIITRLRDGEVESTVEDRNQPRLFE